MAKRKEKNIEITTSEGISVNILDFLSDNRTEIDESLVSLRYMRKIEEFLQTNKSTKRDLALKLEYSESYISQLMTGTKKINVSFINKFENRYNVHFDVVIKHKEEINEWMHINIDNFITYANGCEFNQKRVDLSKGVYNVFRSEDNYLFKNYKKITNER